MMTHLIQVSTVDDSDKRGRISTAPKKPSSCTLSYMLIRIGFGASLTTSLQARYKFASSLSGINTQNDFLLPDWIVGRYSRAHR